MKNRELVEMLLKGDPEAEVILQKDSEGNGYSPLAGVDLVAVYVPENSYSGEVYSIDWSAEDSGKTEEEWQEILTGPRCVVLFPLN